MNPVGWFDIYVNNLERAQKFYEEVFDIKLENVPTPDDTKMLAFPSNSEFFGATGALVKIENVLAGPGGTVVYFSCDDCAIEQARVEKAGGKVQFAKKDIGEYGFISMVLDSEGNMIGLHSMK